MQEPTGVGPPAQEASATNEETFNNEAQGGQQVLRANADPYAHESVEQSAQMYAHSNGAMPPHQVYVSAGVPGIPPAAMAGLESDFQALGFKQEDSSGTDQLTNSGPNSENNLEEMEGEDTEEDPVKLFVGQVRQSSLSEVFRRT